MALPVEIVSGAVATTREAVVVETSMTSLILQGRVFSSGDFINIPSGSSRRILFNPTALGVDGEVFFMFPVFVATGGPVEIEFYRNSDYTGGTALKVYNKFIGFDSLKSELTIDPTGSNEGERLFGVLLPTSSTHFGTTSESVGSDMLDVITGADTLLVRISNNDNVIVKVGYSMLWIEREEE